MLALGLTLIVLPLATLRASGQSVATLNISTPITDSFPSIYFYLTLSEAVGSLPARLPASSVQVLEDGVSRQASRVDQVERGTRQLFILNTDEPMSVRDTRGRSRYVFVREALQRWWTGADASVYGIDDLTLVSGDGPLVEHASSSARLASRLQDYTPTYQSSNRGLALLLDSLGYLEGSSQDRQGPTFVVFVTSTLRTEQDLALTNAIARANELGTTVFPVVIDSAEAIEKTGYAPLTSLAEATGGTVLILDTTAPDLEELSRRVLAQRNQYRVEYESRVNRPGFHELSVRVNTPQAVAESQPRSFEIAIEAPQLTLVQPPNSITRESEDPGLPISQLPPTELPLQVVIRFPDGKPRAIEESRLLVDGQVVDRHLEPPFDSLVWDLSGIGASGTHTLEAIVLDQLGLEARTSSHTVSIVVVGPASGIAALRPALGPFLLILGILMLAALVAIVVVNFRRRPLPQTTSQEPSAGNARRLTRARLQPTQASSAEAMLIPLLDDESEGEPIPLLGSDLTLGRNASLAAYPLDDSSVSDLHARLIRQAGGGYLLRDQGSVAGTWVNYDEVGEEGRILRHGDIVYLGRVRLRFQRMNQPPPELRVQKLEDGRP
jgi:pSer/pThr/pTyr-binding forkhead associated (FHA) protein